MQFHLLARILLNPGCAFLDVLHQVGQADIKQLLLIIRDLADRVDLLHTVRAQLDVAREELAASIPVQVRVNKSWLDDALLALCSLQQALREPCARHCHRKRGGAGAILGLDDFIATKLHSAHKVIQLFTLEVVAGL